MLREKWQKLLLREKVLLISGISVILCIPLSLITLYCMAVSMVFFVVSVFYNLYKFMQTANVSISKAIEIDTQKVSGAVNLIALRLAFGIGIPMILVLLIYLWIAI